MCKQLEIFDFIEKPQEQDREKRTILETIFGKVNNPATRCANCLCERCANNVENLWSIVRPEEQKKPCFNCDECRYYTGNSNHKYRRMEDCREFLISDYAATCIRKKFKKLDFRR